MRPPPVLLQALLWLYKLAEAEEVLETSVAWLLQLNKLDVQQLYEVGCRTLDVLEAFRGGCAAWEQGPDWKEA